MKILTACHTGINRYIVGCKYRQCRCPHQNIRELIDTQWDVNNKNLKAVDTWKLELIDTQWDVNVNKDSDSQGKIVELIDTQWDVNTYKLFKTIGCKRELIDTQWDVNFSHVLLSVMNTPGINRYIVGCK